MQLEQEAYDEKNKLLNQSQFQELLELQTDEEPDFVEEIVDMYITDAKDMLKELSDVFSDGKLAGAADGKPDYNLARAVLHKLKGSSSTFGADGVQQKCEELREYCLNEVGEEGEKGGDCVPPSTIFLLLYSSCSFIFFILKVLIPASDGDCTDHA